VSFDVADLQSVDKLFATTHRYFGGVDIVVAGAAIGTHGKSVDESDPVTWTTIINVNLIGAYFTSKSAVPYLLKSRAGKLIFIGSGVERCRTIPLTPVRRPECGCWSGRWRRNLRPPMSVSTSFCLV